MRKEVEEKVSKKIKDLSQKAEKRVNKNESYFKTLKNVQSYKNFRMIKNFELIKDFSNKIEKYAFGRYILILF